MFCMNQGKASQGGEWGKELNIYSVCQIELIKSGSSWLRASRNAGTTVDGGRNSEL